MCTIGLRSLKFLTATPLRLRNNFKFEKMTPAPLLFSKFIKTPAGLHHRFVLSLTPLLAICASFHASSLTCSSGGLIITAHTSPYLFYSVSSCTYDSYMIKNERFLAYFMRILNSYVVKRVSNCQPCVSATLAATFFARLLFNETPWCLCTCEMPCRSIGCVLHSCFNALPDIFAFMNCPVFALSAVFSFLLRSPNLERR